MTGSRREPSINHQIHREENHLSTIKYRDWIEKRTIYQPSYTVLLLLLSSCFLAIGVIKHCYQLFLPESCSLCNYPWKTIPSLHISTGTKPPSSNVCFVSKETSVLYLMQVYKKVTKNHLPLTRVLLENAVT